MNTYLASRAAIDEIRGLLQAAQFAAQSLEQHVVTQEPVESLSDHIHRVKAAADMMRARIQRSIRRAASGQLPDLAKVTERMPCQLPPSAVIAAVPQH